MNIYLLIPKVANYFGGPVDTGSGDTETSPYFPPHIYTTVVPVVTL